VYPGTRSPRPASVTIRLARSAGFTCAAGSSKSSQNRACVCLKLDYRNTISNQMDPDSVYAMCTGSVGAVDRSLQDLEAEKVGRGDDGDSARSQ
jgi:hypothetical protein